MYFNVRLEDEKSCVLVIMGATEEGRKELVAIETGFRESELGWKEILLSLKERGLEDGPKLAIRDGALGFWKALKQIYPNTRQQRCWGHRTRNVLDKLPKSLQKEAKTRIHNIYTLHRHEKRRKMRLKGFSRFMRLNTPKLWNACEKPKRKPWLSLIFQRSTGGTSGPQTQLSQPFLRFGSEHIKQEDAVLRSRSSQWYSISTMFICTALLRLK